MKKNLNVISKVINLRTIICIDLKRKKKKQC